MELSTAEIARYLRMGRAQPEGALADRIAALRGEACAAMRPARVWRRIALPFHAASRKLAARLAGCREAYLVCATLGARLDALQRRLAVTSGSDAWIVQAIGAAAIEKYMDETEDALRAELSPGETLVPRYSPGYGDFPLSAQAEILGALDAARRLGVSLTETDLMIPSKSVSAVVGVCGAS